jgi:hypothetical protein
LQAKLNKPISLPQVDLPEGVLDEGRHEHHKWTWLQPGRRMDKQKRKPGQNGYNPRTLYVDPTFLKKQTPAMQQWWEVKSENMDTVLFFKVRELAGHRCTRCRRLLTFSISFLFRLGNSMSSFTWTLM